MSQRNGETAPVAQEKINTDIVTLTRFLTEEQTKHKEATGDFTYAEQILKTCKQSFEALTHCIQSVVPRPTILFQIYRVLHPPSHADQSHRTRRILKYYR